MSQELDLQHQKILVTGASGFLGGYVIKELVKNGANEKNIITPRSKDSDLRERKNCLLLTEGVDLVIHMAGNVGGIGKNQEMPGTLFYDNAIMGIELMEAARKNNVKKFVCISTICAYPKYTQVPFKEDDIWTGYPEETNAAYGLAKKMLLVQAQAYKQEFGFNSIYLLPVNMYGPNDNFNPDSSHVIPAAIKKICDAKKENLEFVEMWGDGTPTREFLYVEDAALGIVQATKLYNNSHPVNLGSGTEISIKDLITLIAKELDFKGEIRWDTSKPNGQPRRLLDVSRAYNEFQFKAQTSFKQGLKNTIDWYINYDKK
jgi:GDP-L-fucose synthase